MSDLHVLGGGQPAFDAILGHMARAQKSIEIHAFLWCDDDIGNRLGQAVLDAADRGVQVEIHKDRVAAVYEISSGTLQSFFHKKNNPTEKLQAWFIGRSGGPEKSPEEKKALKKELRAVDRVERKKRRRKRVTEKRVAKAERKEQKKQKPNPLVDKILSHPNIQVSHEKKRFDHSKIFIFDEEVLVLGSMGIGDDHYNDWIDVMIEARGAEYVQRLKERMAGDAEFDPKRRVDFLLHNQGAHEKKTCPMLHERLNLIDAAKERLVIEMAYIGDVRFTDAIVRAVKRGVEVTLVTGREVNVLRALARATITKILRTTNAPDNLTIILHPRMVHAKMVVVDGRYCDVGSANFTKLSHGVYDEVNLYVDDEDLAKELEAHAESHRAGGEVVRGQLSYKKFLSQVERATVAYQARNGG